MPATRTFTYGDMEITIYTEPTNRQREYSRRIQREWAEHYDPVTALEFAHIVAYTAEVKGGWTPNGTGAGLETWLDLPLELTDMWFNAISTHGKSLDTQVNEEKKQT